MGGGQSGTLSFFFKSVTYRPTLSKFRVGPVKKNTLYDVVLHPGGNLFALSNSTLLIKDLTYDGLGPDAFFLAGDLSHQI